MMKKTLGLIFASLALVAYSCGGSTNTSSGDRNAATSGDDADEGAGSSNEQASESGSEQDDDAPGDGSDESSVGCDSGETRSCEGDDCSGQQSCDGGEWGECVCPQRICQAGEHRCAGSILQQCRDDATAWVDLETCSADANCNAAEARCEDAVCTPDEFRCAGDLLQQCRADGSVWDDVQVCGAGNFCDARNGACRPHICFAGEYRCLDNLLQECRADRSAFDDVEQCAVGETCDAITGACLKPICTPGSYGCDGRVLRRCRADGFAWENLRTCPVELECDAALGECVGSQCVPGEYRCVEQSLQGCNQLGIFAEVQQCQADERCDANLQQCVFVDGAVDIRAVAGKLNEYGFALRDSFYLIPCFQIQAHHCLTVTGACPNQGADIFEEKGEFFIETFELTGNPDRLYEITLEINGIVEARYYENGQRRDGDNWAGDNALDNNDLLYVGGNPIPSSYNVYKISVFGNDYNPDDNENPLQHFYLNSAPDGTGAESHRTFPIGYELTIEGVPGDAVIEYLWQDSSCRAINNCGPGGNEITCASARHVPNEPGLQVPEEYGGRQTSVLNPITDGMQPWHAQMIHVTVTEVRATQ